METLNTMKLSKETIEILKNFSTINSNILVEPGNVIKTISPVKNVMSEATVSETFDTQFGIWDLGKFLGTISLFDDAEFFFSGEVVTDVSVVNDCSRLGHRSRLFDEKG